MEQVTTKQSRILNVLQKGSSGVKHDFENFRDSVNVRVSYIVWCVSECENTLVMHTLVMTSY